jgi:hypothetical protein
MLTSPWIQRLAALMLVPLTVGAIYAFVIEPLMSAYRETETRIADTRAQLVHLRRLAEQRPALAAQVEALLSGRGHGCPCRRCAPGQGQGGGWQRRGIRS